MNSCNTPRQSVLNLPENSPSQINIMLHQPHPTILGPASLIIVAHNVFIIWVGVLSQKPLDELSCFIRHKPEHDVNVVDVAHVHTDGVTGLGFDGFEQHELVLVFGWACELLGTTET